MSAGDKNSPVQEQDYPGVTEAMTPRPADEMRDYVGRGLLAGRRALVTGGEADRKRLRDRTEAAVRSALPE